VVELSRQAGVVGVLQAEELRVLACGLRVRDDKAESTGTSSLPQAKLYCVATVILQWASFLLDLGISPSYFSH
jgi:hypothetical protein